MNAIVCEAKQFDDTMMCGRCCMKWDVNDPIKPACGKAAASVASAAKARADQAIAKAREAACQ